MTDRSRENRGERLPARPVPSRPIPLPPPPQHPQDQAQLPPQGPRLPTSPVASKSPFLGKDMPWVIFTFMMCAILSAATVLFWDKAQPIFLEAAPTFIVGMLGGLAWTLWPVTEGKEVSLPVIILKTMTGGVFGFLGGKVVVGVGGNDNLSTAIAGIAGGQGPPLLAKFAERVAQK